LAIRGQQSENITKASQATVAQQSATENQNLAQLMSDPIKNGLVDQDGNPTKDAQTIIMRAAPTTGAQHLSNLLDAATKKIGFNSSINALRLSDRTELANAVAGVTARAQQPSDITDALDSVVESKKGTPEYGNYQTIAGTMKLAINHLATKTAGNNPAAPGKEPWRIGAANIASSIGGGQPTAQNTGAGVVNRDPIIGTLSQIPGAATGSPINPTPPQVAAQTTTQAGTAADDNTRNAQISSSVAPSRMAVTLADQVANLADQVHTGKFSKAVTDYMGTIGQKDPTIAARQLISKYAAQLKTVATTNAPTDAARAQIDAGFPDPEHMTPEAIKGASEYIKGSMLMNLSRAANARNFTTTHKSTQGLRIADDQLTSNADPLMYTYQNLPKGPERTQFIQRHFNSAQDAADFVRRKNAVEHYGGFAQ
jgi:hypothetical protein